MRISNGSLPQTLNPSSKMMWDNNDEEKSKSKQLPVPKKRHQKDITLYIHSARDWRRMFDEEIACDITIDVDGMLIKAHKSVLTSRCQYFAAMFSGKSKDTINIMYLDGFSYECVHFALCQIYSGNSNIPDNIDIFELADLADLLCLEGLKELVAHILEYDYFHEFHKPCEECALLISKFLPWSGAIGYAEIYYKILFWIKQYCDEIWTKKEFALLPYDVVQKCFLHHTLDMDSDNVLEMVKCCDKLMCALPKVTWTANIFRFALKLLRDCIQYIREHLVEVLSTESFSLLGSDSDDSIYRLEARMTAAIERAEPVQVCSAYAQLHRLLHTKFDSPSMTWQQLLTRLTIHCEDALISCASQAMCTSAWLDLQPELQERIQKSSGIMTTSTYSKLIQNTSKYTRDRNVERIKYILYSQLGSINRVPIAATRQLLPVPAISKSCVTVPGNSMVSSTKTSNLNNTRNSTAQTYKNNYKNIKSRYLNPKPERSIPDVVPSIPKTVSNPPVSNPVNKRCPPKLTKVLSNDVKNKKFPDVTNTKAIPRSPKKNDIVRSTADLAKTVSLKQILNKKVSKSENIVGIQSKSGPPFRGKSSMIAYVSPYSFRSLDMGKSAKNSPNQPSSLKIINKTNDSKSLSSSFPDKVGFASSDPKLSVDKDYKPSARSSFNKSPTFKKSNDNSSYSSPLSQRSQKMATVYPIRSKNEPQSPAKSAFMKEHPISKSPVMKDKNPTFYKSTLSFSVKMTKKTAYEPKDKILRHIPMKTNKSAPEVNLRNSLQNSTVSDSSTDSSINYVLERSRTFVMSEPSIISKEITMDSSIEMYPE